MNLFAFRMVARLMALEVIITGLTELTVVAFSKRLLLLEDDVVTASTPLAIVIGVALIATQLLTTVFMTQPLRPMLRALSVGSAAIAPTDVLALYTLPWRKTIVNIACALVLCGVTVVPGIRPQTNDLTTQLELLLLTVTMGSVATLPGYAMFRATVTRVMELVPPSVATEALHLLELHPTRFSRVRTRILVAVVAPVSFVALGASLLVIAHVRASEAVSRLVGATQLARGALEVVEGSAAGRAEAIAAAARHGYRIEIDEASATFDADRKDQGMTEVRIPLESGHARVLFPTTRLSMVVGIYGLLALAATVLAAAVGVRLGASYVGDLALVTKEVRSIGVADILRGTRVQREVRFVSSAKLMQAIDELGAIFREFASAQEKAIDARTATERMRGLFLASMSHDLKAPLNAVLGFAELASRNPLSPAQRESLAIIEQRGRELLHLVQTILDAARVEAGELSLSQEPTMVGDVIMAAVDDARELTGEQDGVTIVAEVQQGVPRLFVDAARITQALSAVLVTVTRFADERRVRVFATRAGPNVRIDVEAPGHGVPDAELAKIFEAFKDPERARRHGSLGLGLSLARSLIELHDGVIEASATAAQGTLFRIVLPGTDRGLDPPSSRRPST